MQWVKRRGAKFEAEMRRMGEGWLRACFGSGVDRSGNAAILVILLCFSFIALAALKIDFDKQFDNFLKVFSILLSLVTLALGYLFGSRDK